MIARELAMRLSRLIPRRPDGFTLAIAAVALLGAAAVLYRQTAYGASTTADSAHYVAMASNVLAGHGFLSFYGGYPPHWPPLTPMLYAVFSFGVFHPLAVAAPLNAAIFAGAVFALGAWLRRRLESRLVVIWACLAVVFAPSIVGMFDWALSEPPFILLSTLALYCADRHLEDGRRSSLAWAAAMSALACLSRYLGVSLVVAIAGMVILRRGAARRERLSNAAAYSAVSLLPMTVWMARNWFNEGTLAGNREARETAWEHIPLMLDAMADWRLAHIPIPGAEGAAAWIVACALALTAALTLFALLRWRRTGESRLALAPLAVGFAFAHAALTLIGMTSGIADDLDRYVSPLYIPLLAAAALALDRALSWARRRGRLDGSAKAKTVRRAATALIAGLAAWTAFGAYVSALDARDRADGHQEGRTARVFHQSETIAYLREALGAEAGTVFSNEPLQAFLASAGRGLYLPPPYEWSGMSAEARRRRGADGETLIAWFHDGLRTEYGASAFRFSPGFKPLGDFQDGEVFRLKPGYPPSDPRDGNSLSLSYYDVYLSGGALTWVRQPCSDDDAMGAVELSVNLLDPAHLPPEARDAGAIDMNFAFSVFGAKLGDLCVARRSLPNHPIKSVRTGQQIHAAPGEWLYRTRIEMASEEDRVAYYRTKYETASSAGEPLIRSEYDVYSDSGALVYLKDDCQDEHTRGRFLLSVFPVRLSDIPEDRREAGHASVNFDFSDYGARFDGRCAILRGLPSYPIKAVEIGRFIPGGREIWREWVEIGD